MDRSKLDDSISVLNMSTRLYLLLRRNGISTMRDVLSHNLDEYWMDARGQGPWSADHIEVESKARHRKYEYFNVLGKDADLHYPRSRTALIDIRNFGITSWEQLTTAVKEWQEKNFQMQLEQEALDAQQKAQTVSSERYAQK